MSSDTVAAETTPVRFVYDDGGREAAGLSPAADAGDCVTRALSIALGLPYEEVRATLAQRMGEATLAARRERLLPAGCPPDHPAVTEVIPGDPDLGVEPHVTAAWLLELGWKYQLNDQHTRGLPVFTMHDLAQPGRYIVEFREREPQANPRRGAGHLTAVVDGENRDLFDNTDSPMWGWWSRP